VTHLWGTGEVGLSGQEERRASWLRRSVVLREARTWPTVVLVLLCLFVGVPTTILLTPDQTITIAGQSLSVGARDPSLSIAGPAQLVQIGNTRLDITPLQVYGPLRPRLTLGPVQRNPEAAAALNPSTRGDLGATATSTLTWAFIRWYGFATVGLLAFTLAATAVVAYLRTLLTLRRSAREEHRALTATEIWQRSAGQIRGMSVIAVVVALLGWAGSGALAYTGAVDGLQRVRTLADLVGTYHLSPSPVGPPVRGYVGAVIGDSRASRVGGPPVAKASDDDIACARSADSLADEIGALRGERVLNLACSGASIARGLRGPQPQGGRVMAPQIGRLKQVQDLSYVVVVIGPNDLYWADFLAYCYGVPDCRDNLTQGEFDYRLAAFDRDYGDLLQDLNELPGQPQIVIVTSYDVFDPNATCADAKGPAGASGLTRVNLDLLASRNAALNDVLTSGAQKYGFTVARPRLAPLCSSSPDKLGPDLQGLSDRYPFHPTGLGMVRMASAVSVVIRSKTGD
jgi:GDSL-like Lipase/Acylhydrolase family